MINSAADHWPSIAPHVTDTWSTLREICQRSKRGTGPVIHALTYGVSQGLVEERGGGHKGRKTYRKRQRSAP